MRKIFFYINPAPTPELAPGASVNGVIIAGANPSTTITPNKPARWRTNGYHCNRWLVIEGEGENVVVCKLY